MAEEKNDYFESSAEEPEKPKEPKKPRLTPDDPRYWDEPESEYEHLRPSPRSRVRLWFWLILTALVIGVAWGVYLRYFHAYISEATQYGYVEQLERHGNVLSTYEGVLLPYKSLMDTTRTYEGDMAFSTRSPEVAARLKKMQFANNPVRITYEVYHTTVPWRGKSRIVVTAVDSVGERDILPPDRNSYLPREEEVTAN